MKLNFLCTQQNEGREDFVLTGNIDSDDIERPMGVTKSEWTTDMKAHFKAIKKSNPKLYQKILMGH